MSHPALDLLAAKAKLAGAVVAGAVVATAALGGGPLSLVADSSGVTPAPVTCTATADTTCPDPAEAPKAADPAEAPEAAEPADAPEPAEAPEAPEAADAPDAAEDPAAADTQVVLNHATVVSSSATSLVVTAAGATTTWTVAPETRFSGAIKDPAQILAGMVIHLQGTKAGDAYTATHVVTPGNNKAKHVKAAKKAHDKKVHAAKTHATHAHGKK